MGLRERRDPGFVAVDDFLILTESKATPDSCPVQPREADISATTTTQATTAPPAADFTGCDFAVDLCDWWTEGGNFYWERANAAQFAGTGVESPSGDFEHTVEGIQILLYRSELS